MNIISHNYGSISPITKPNKTLNSSAFNFSFKIKNTKKSQAIAHYAKTHFLFSKISGKFRSIQSISTDNFSAA